MKKLFYYLFCFLFILACTDEEESEVIQDGKITFWIQEDFMCGPISVTIDGETRTINNFNASGAPECGASGSANFTLPDGQYSFFASCDGMTWEGVVNSNEGSCSLMQLTPGNNPPPPPSGTGKATFWTRTDLGCGPITVSVAGQSRNITAYHSSGPANCGASGAANFDLSAGTHNFTASCDGTTWQGTVTVTSNGCSFSELTADDGPPPSGNGKVTFWTSQDFGCGPITVSVNGQSATINSYYTGGINGCDISGCANFSLPAGNYSFSASCQGFTWSGTVTVSSNGCMRMQLT